MSGTTLRLSVYLLWSEIKSNLSDLRGIGIPENRGIPEDLREGLGGRSISYNRQSVPGPNYGTHSNRSSHEVEAEAITEFRSLGKY